MHTFAYSFLKYLEWETHSHTHPNTALVVCGVQVLHSIEFAP